MPKKWMYGLTTTPERRHTLLPETLQSLSSAGFDKPHIFVDDLDPDTTPSWEKQFNLPITGRWPRIKPYGNWLLALVELVIRNPLADFYMICQDDFLTYRNLRTYLETCRYPDRGYWSLYTRAEDEQKVPLFNGQKKIGWHLSCQRGLGAVGLVFSQAIAYRLLCAGHTFDRMRNLDRGCRAIDGGVVESMAHQGCKEWTHYPSLVYHTGVESTIAKVVPTHPRVQPQAATFYGKDFDAMEFVGK